MPANGSWDLIRRLKFKSNFRRPMLRVCYQRYAPQRPLCSKSRRSHPQQKYEAPHKITFPLEPTIPAPHTRQCHTKTEKTVAS
jgi:hypothetical protein